MAASSSRGRSSSPFGYRKPSSPYSSSSSSSSLMNGRLIPRSCSSSASSQFYSSGARSMTPNRTRSDSGLYPGSRAHRSREPIGFASAEELVEAADASRSGDSISVTVRFRPLSEREIVRGDEIAWYADGDKVVRSEYNPATAYAFVAPVCIVLGVSSFGWKFLGMNRHLEFKRLSVPLILQGRQRAILLPTVDRVFGPATASKVVYDVAARPVVKAAMDGVNGTVFAYGVTSSGKTHTMHGDQNSPGIIPLAIKDVFSLIQDVINDLLDPTGQNLRVREDSQFIYSSDPSVTAPDFGLREMITPSMDELYGVRGTYVEGIKEEVVLSPGHALSFIAAGEGSPSVVGIGTNLIDLAGSESSKTETTGLRRKEGSYINKSLLTLGTVGAILLTKDLIPPLLFDILAAIVLRGEVIQKDVEGPSSISQKEQETAMAVAGHYVKVMVLTTMATVIPILYL
ncbi:hypothetical protein ACLOJK_027801 [Asimina triloba]